MTALAAVGPIVPAIFRQVNDPLPVFGRSPEEDRAAKLTGQRHSNYCHIRIR